MASRPLLAAWLLLVGCVDPSDDVPTLLSSCTEAEGEGGLTVNGISIDDNEELIVNLSYSGGCAEHEIVLCWPDRTITAEEPSRTQFELWHDANGDTCEAVIEEDRRFDLDVVLDAYRASYGGSGTLILEIDGHEATYVFGD